MPLNELQFPVAYYANRAYFFERSNRYSPTYLGGPSEVAFAKGRYSSTQLHHIFTITSSVIPEMQEDHVYEVPLFYGLRYSGCELTYRMPKNSTCKIVKLSPDEPSPNWPYPNYPSLLPYLPLSLARWEYCEPAEFVALTHQGLEIQPKTIVVIVPPIFTLGVSMWGKRGDAEGVQIIFECDFKRKTIKASNQST
ncbi:MAG TPA: hypothetical protein VFZ34_27170 [Blastocatellia bacterium]|nr:hypothetical protein [Blastocatellia bacterium]